MQLWLQTRKCEKSPQTLKYRKYFKKQSIKKYPVLKNTPIPKGRETRIYRKTENSKNINHPTFQNNAIQLQIRTYQQ